MGLGVFFNKLIYSPKQLDRQLMVEINTTDHWRTFDSAFVGYPKKIKELIASGAPLAICDQHGDNLLFQSLYKTRKDAFEILLATERFDLTAKNHVGETILHRALCEKKLWAVSALLRAKAPLDARDGLGQTPLMTAIDERHDIAVIREMIPLWGDINAIDNEGRTALHYAAMEGLPDVASLLIQSGADIEARDRKSHGTPLYWAAQRGMSDIMKRLIDAKADINARDKDGYTPLMAACWDDYTVAGDILIAAGADLHAKSNDGETALDCAENAEALQMCDMLNHALQLEQDRAAAKEETLRRTMAEIEDTGMPAQQKIKIRALKPKQR